MSACYPRLGQNTPLVQKKREEEKKKVSNIQAQHKWSTPSSLCKGTRHLTVTKRQQLKRSNWNNSEEEDDWWGKRGEQRWALNLQHDLRIEDAKITPGAHAGQVYLKVVCIYAALGSFKKYPNKNLIILKHHFPKSTRRHLFDAIKQVILKKKERKCFFSLSCL